MISDVIAHRIIDIRDRCARHALEAYDAADELELLRWLADIERLAQEAIQLTRRDHPPAGGDASGGRVQLRLVPPPDDCNDP